MSLDELDRELDGLPANAAVKESVALTPVQEDVRALLVSILDYLLELEDVLPKPKGSKDVVAGVKRKIRVEGENDEPDRALEYPSRATVSPPFSLLEWVGRHLQSSLVIYPDLRFLSFFNTTCRPSTRTQPTPRVHWIDCASCSIW